MQIRCYGARGSIAVSGPSHLKYGGDTTCLEIRADSGSEVIIDAGTGIRRLGLDLLKRPSADYHILFTHLHWDHVIGFPVFAPLYQADTTIHMLSRAYEPDDLERAFQKIMHPPGFPVSLKQVVADIRYEPIDKTGASIGGLQIKTIALDHPQGGVGYTFTENGHTFVMLTDNEVSRIVDKPDIFDRYVAFCRGADLLLHDAQYTPEEYVHTRGWGHSTYTDAVRLAAAAGVKRLGLFHHDPERTDDEIDATVTAARALMSELAADTDCFAAAQNDVYTV
jgi:phosphoribosyl 1,2-cyclic phosphodiesterase